MKFDPRAARTIPAQIFSNCVYWTLTILAMIVFPAAAYAQTTTGSISGTVIDQPGNIVPAGCVSVANEANGDLRRIETSSTGEFSFPSLLPGACTVQVEVQGFQTYRSMFRNFKSGQRLAGVELPLGDSQCVQPYSVPHHRYHREIQCHRRPDPTLGQAIGAYPARQMQFSLSLRC
jgi:hypothetical protein